jgi:hypothetical protein
MLAACETVFFQIMCFVSLCLCHEGVHEGDEVDKNVESACAMIAMRMSNSHPGRRL